MTIMVVMVMMMMVGIGQDCGLSQAHCRMTILVVMMVMMMDGLPRPVDTSCMRNTWM